MRQLKLHQENRFRSSESDSSFQEEKLMGILTVYGVSNYKPFYDRVRNFKERITPRDELTELAGRLPEENIQVLLGLAKAQAEGQAILSY